MLLGAGALALLFFSAAAVSIATVPQQLLINAPFRVSVNSSGIASVFVAPDNTCRAAMSGGSPTTLISGTAAFQVSFGSAAQTQTVYLCDAGSATPIAPLTFESISFSPPYGIRNTFSTISFSAATPNNAMIEIRELSDCVSGTPAAGSSLDVNNRISVMMTSSFFYFICVSFVSPVTLQFIKLNVGQFVVTDPSNFAPTIVVTNQAVSFEVRGAAPPFTHVFISSASDCSVVSQGTLDAGGQFGKTVSFVISLPRAMYTFCIENPRSSGIYIPSGTLEVRQFGVNPATLFAGRSTLFSPALDTPSNASVSVSATLTCAPPFVAGPTTLSQALWNISDPGVYYSCVFVSGSYVLASTHAVVPQYVVTTDVDTVVRGLSITVSVVAPGPVQVSICSDSCSAPLFTGPTANAKVTFQVGKSDLASLSSAVICVRTVDSSYTYPLITLPVRDFMASTGPLLTGTPGNIYFDNETAGASYGFAQSSLCSSFVVSGTVPPTLVDTVRFSVSGLFFLCIRTNVAFLPLATVTVFPVPTTAPSMSIAKFPTALQFSSVPPFAPVSIGTSCFNTIQNATSVSSDVTIVFAADYQSTWVLCAGIPDSNGLFTMFPFGNVTFYSVTHSPTYHVAGVPGYFSLSTEQPSLVNGLSAMLSPTSDCSVVGTSPQQVANLTFFSTPQLAGTMFACIGNIQKFVPIGVDNILPAITSTPDISPTLSRIPIQLIIESGNYTADFFIVSQSQSCSPPAFRGLVNRTTGQTDSISAITGTYFVCITSDDDVTLLPAGSFAVGTFQALSTSLAIGLPNTLRVSPLVAGALLFLTQDANCSSEQYFTSPTTVLSAPPGSYTLCQQFRGGTSPSINEVKVLAPFVGLFPATPIKQFVPFDITLSGGDINLRTNVAVYTVLASENCTSGTVISLFSSSVPTFVTVVVSAGQYVDVRFCISSVDAQVVQSIGIVKPQPYMFPYSVVAGIPVTISSSLMKFGFARLSPKADCNTEASDIATLSGFNSTITLPLSTTGSFAVYCESADGISFTARGILNLLHFSPSGGSNVTIGLENRTVLPGRPISLAVSAQLGKRPYAVRNSCSDLPVDLSGGYNPQENEDASFFICVLSPDETLLFTTTYKSLKVQHYVLTPRTIATARQDQQLSLAPWPTTQATFVSNSPSCNGSLAATSALIGGAAAVNVMNTGLLFLCIGVLGEAVSVASFVSVDIPTLQNISLPIANVPLCFSLSVGSGVYSMLPNVDDSNPMRPYFKTDNRSVFWSSTSDNCLLGIGTDTRNISDPNKICLNVAQSEGIVICAATPAGNYPVSGTISTKAVYISPVAFVVDTVREVQISNCQNCTFAISLSPGCSDANKLTSTFRATSDGLANLSTVSLTAGTVLSPGNYTLCYGFNGAWFGVSSISLFAPVSFSMSNAAIVAGVESRISLLQDLTTEFLLSGVFSSPSCNQLSPSVNWTSLNTTTIKVSSLVSATGDVFFCGVCPINGSIVAIQRLRVLSSFIQFPNSIIVCSPAIVSLQTDVGNAQVTVYNGPCCTGKVDSSQVVEQAISIAPLVRSFTVSPNDLEIFYPVSKFSYCFWNASLCLDLGPAVITGAACIPPTPRPAQQTPAPVVNSSLLNFLGAAASGAAETSFTTLTILIIVFGSLVLCAVLACCVHWYVRSGRVVPADVEEQNEHGTNWKRSFDGVLAPSLRKSRTSALHVPMDMTLDICREAPMAMQQLDVEEGKQRQELERVEQAVLDEIVRAMYKERQAVMGYSVALERTRIIETVNSLLGLECGEVQAQEDYDRRMLEEDEESNLLQIAEMERTSWRQVMDIEGRRLQLALERDPFWRTRRQQLREANSRALLSTDQAYSPSRNISYSSAGGGSPTPYRTVDAQRRDPRLETW